MQKNINKKLIINILFTISCLLVYIFFPAKDFFQQTVATIAFLILLPLAYRKIILKEDFASMGFRKGNWEAGVKWLGITLFIGIILFFVIIKNTDFLNQYKLPIMAVKNFWYFLLYELIFVPFFIILYEIFFRGFLLFSFSEKIGYYAILLQFLAFFLLFSLQGFRYEFFPYFIFSLFAGIIAYKSESIWYSFLGQYIFIFLIDVSVIKMLQ